MATSADYLAAAFSSNSIWVWNLKSKDHLQCTLSGHEKDILALEFLGNDHLASCSADKTIKIWSIASGRCIRNLIGHLGAVCCLSSCDNSIITGSKDRTLIIWDLRKALPSAVLRGHHGGIRAVKCWNFESTKTIASSSSDGTVRLWNYDRRECCRILRITEDDAVVVGLAYCEGFLLCSTSEQMSFWDLDAFECRQTISCKERLKSVKLHMLTRRRQEKRFICIGCTEDGMVHYSFIPNGKHKPTHSVKACHGVQSDVCYQGLAILYATTISCDEGLESLSIQRISFEPYYPWNEGP